MSISRTFGDGLSRTVTRNGLLFVVLFGVTSAVNTAAYNSLMANFLSDSVRQSMVPTGPELSLSPAIAGIILLMAYLATFALTAAAIRTFVTDETRTIPGEFLTRNLGWFLVNYVAGFVVFVVLVTLGSFLLVVPGLFLAVSFYFWFVFVAVEDENFVDAFGSSWALTGGDRWSLFGLGLLVFLVGAVLYGASIGLAQVLSPWITLVVNALVGGIFGVVCWATTARAYVHLTHEGSKDGDVAPR